VITGRGIWGSIAGYAVTVLAVIVVLRQCRRPAWLPGRLFLEIMNNSHSGVTNWGLTHVALGTDFTILDVGCGGGRTVSTLAAATQGMVRGIDYSAASVAASRRTNVRRIEAGRVDIQQGTVSRLPFADGTFDLVTAVETHYYWPDPTADFGEILRVLKPGGRVVVIAETYRGRRFDALYLPVMRLLRATYLSVDEHEQLLVGAGYSEVEVYTERAKGWICAVGKRPG
jgi:SAM-dependent methyltransferase